MLQLKIKYANCKTEEEGEVCLSNSISREQRSCSHLCDSGDWITRPLHQECNQKHSNTPPRHFLSICQDFIASGSKNIHQVFSNYLQCSDSPSMVLFSFLHPLNLYYFVVAYLFIYLCLFVSFPFLHLFSCCVILSLPSPCITTLFVTHYIGSS